MRWYKHDPNAALAGMIGLTVEERGAYYTLIDLLYARAPAGNVTDELVINALAINPRTWRKLKRSLIAKGKIRETPHGLDANRVRMEVEQAANRMRMTRELRVRQLKNQEVRPNGVGRQRTDNHNQIRSSSFFMLPRGTSEEESKQESLEEIVKRKWAKDG